jgi:hypothetical protein
MRWVHLTGMNKIYKLQRERAGRSNRITNSIMALLLVVGLSQMAICFNSAVKLVPDRPPRVTTGAALTQTNSATAHGATPASHQKI